MFYGPFIRVKEIELTWLWAAPGYWGCWSHHCRRHWRLPGRSQTRHRPRSWRRSDFSLLWKKPLLISSTNKPQESFESISFSYIFLRLLNSQRVRKPSRSNSLRVIYLSRRGEPFGAPHPERSSSKALQAPDKSPLKPMTLQAFRKECQLQRLLPSRSSRCRLNVPYFWF